MEANFFITCNESNDSTKRGRGKTHYIPPGNAIINFNDSFYSAELLLALEHLHELDVVYRYVRLPSTRISI